MPKSRKRKSRDHQVEETEEVTSSKMLKQTEKVENVTDYTVEVNRNESSSDGTETVVDTAATHCDTNNEAKPEDIDEDERESINIEDSSPKKRNKTPGIIYLSSIPDSMQYNDVYRAFSELGEIGRISLQTGGPQPFNKKRKNYKEGWVEFLDKKKAKRCVQLLNNQQVGGKRKNRWYECLWQMKYLPKFQWSHLTERLAYEQATTQQRMRAEISQARREANHFSEQLDWKQKERIMSKKNTDWKSGKKKYEFNQRMTDDEIRKRKAGSERVEKLEKSRTNVLNNLFGKSS